jgi:hypothetical protein
MDSSLSIIASVTRELQFLQKFVKFTAASKSQQVHSLNCHHSIQNILTEKELPKQLVASKITFSHFFMLQLLLSADVLFLYFMVFEVLPPIDEIIRFNQLCLHLHPFKLL